MTETGEDDLTRATAELGDPESLFRISRARFHTKLWVGLTLILGGIVVCYLWWLVGPGFEIVFAKLLLVIPFSGFALLWHMYRNRGLFVLVYPTGLLRLRRGEVDSFPWTDIEFIRIKVQQAGEPRTEWDANNSPTALWWPTEVPNFQLWKVWLTVVRTDGVEAHFGPVLSDYEQLTEIVQRRTFAVHWPRIRDRFRAGETIAFDDFEVAPAGLRYQKKLLRWRDLKEIVVAQGRFSVKQSGKWLPWALVDMGGVPNPHLLFALVEEARRLVRSPQRQPQAKSRDHSHDAEPEA